MSPPPCVSFFFCPCPSVRVIPPPAAEVHEPGSYPTKVLRPLTPCPSVFMSSRVPRCSKVPYTSLMFGTAFPLGSSLSPPPPCDVRKQFFFKLFLVPFPLRGSPLLPSLHTEPPPNRASSLKSFFPALFVSILILSLKVSPFLHNQFVLALDFLPFFFSITPPPLNRYGLISFFHRFPLLSISQLMRIRNRLQFYL